MGEANSQRLPRPRMAWAVVGAALLFLPLGLISVLLSWRTSVWNGRGDVDRARRASRWALAFIIATYVTGALVYIALVGALLALGAFSSGQ